MRKGFLIYEEMRKYLVNHLVNHSLLDFLKYEENSVFVFISVMYLNLKLDNCSKSENYILVDIVSFPTILAIYM